MEVKREEAVKRLEAASIAVTDNALLEQSNTFVFDEGKLITFDGEMCARQESPFGKEIQGSVIAQDFLKMLQRFPDESVDVTTKDEEIIIKGKRRKAGIKMMAEILLPYADVPAPTKFQKIPEGVQTTLVRAAQVCGRDETAPKTTHVHIAKNRIEATDTFRVFRADIETGVPKDVLVHAVNLVEACKLDLKKMSISKVGWFHFLDVNGMLVSILCSEEEYYKEKMISKLLDVDGETVILPKNLPDILSRAEIMDTPNLSIGGWDSQITILLKENLLQVSSRKEEGWFKEQKKVKYDGPGMKFSIHPDFLKELISQTRTVVINDRQIKIEVGNIHFTTSLETDKK